MTRTNLSATAFHAHYHLSRWSRLMQPWRELTRYLANRRSRAASRDELMTLDDHALRDIGLARIEADDEATKPFWQP